MAPTVSAFQIIAFLGPDSNWETIAGTATLVFAFIGLISLLTKFSQRSRSKPALRLDHFLPFVRKRRFPAGPPAVLVKLAHRLLPASFFFDPATGAEGKLRRYCRKIGPTVLAAPLRRIVQTVCLITFLILFFIVCWPYNARPVVDGKISSDWSFREVNQATGELQFESNASQRAVPGFTDENSVFLASQHESLLSGRVVKIDENGATLLPDEPVTPDAMQQLLLGTGTWAFHEIEPGKWPSHYADNLASKEILPADIFLILDPSKQWL